jgi:hypothetical protein
MRSGAATPAKVRAAATPATVPAKMKTFSVNIDPRVDDTLEDLRRAFGKTSKAEVFRMAIALLKVAAEADAKGWWLAVADGNDRIQQRIVLAS